jgi:hypothetical protein
MKNTLPGASGPDAFREFVYQFLDYAFSTSARDTGIDADTRKEWARLRENSFRAIAALLAFMLPLGMTWLLIEVMQDTKEPHVGLGTVAALLVLSGYGIMIWNMVALARCILFRLRLGLRK